MRRWARALAVSAAAAGAVGWLDPSATPRAAARLYAAGEFDDASARYNEALIDAPDSPLLHFNLGDAEYRRGQFDAAARAFESIPGDAAAEYNRGNALFRHGEAAQREQPQDALQRWAEALVAYRRAIALDPADEDAKFNYEWVTRKIDELQKQLEEQQQQQEQQNQQNQDEDQQGQQDQAAPQRPDEPPAEEPRKPQQDDAAGPGEQPEQPPPSEPRAADAAPAPAPRDGSLSREEATALLDGERSEELQPDEVIRRQLGTGDVPVQDW
jgi:Ca-activated chloride channel family protein